MKKIDDYDFHFAVDIPNATSEEWINIEYFETEEEEAIKFAQEKFGANEKGEVSLISKF